MTHRLVDIKRSDLTCPRCGQVAEVGFGNSAVVATGYMRPGYGANRVMPWLQACEDCLDYWRRTHRCRQRMRAA